MLTLKKTKTKTKQNKNKNETNKQTNIILNKRSAAIKYYNQLSIFTDISDFIWCWWGFDDPPLIHTPPNNTDTSYAVWLETIPVKICHQTTIVIGPLVCRVNDIISLNTYRVWIKHTNAC